ncbi:MAG: LytTR family DNA-binding domain-containing protein [Bacteroidia bacterium]
MSLNSIKSLEQKLPGTRFMRVHRSFIVNSDRMESNESRSIISGKTYIPVSVQCKDEFQEYLDENFL